MSIEKQIKQLEKSGNEFAYFYKRFFVEARVEYILERCEHDKTFAEAYLYVAKLLEH